MKAGVFYGGFKLSSFCALNIKLAGKQCLVIGGGAVALRKTNLLISCQAEVTVLSPNLKEELSKIVDENKICCVRDVYRPVYLKNRFMVICATDDPAVNKKAALACHEQEILVNSVSDPENCTIFFPAKFSQGALQVAVSTGGASPALARRLKEEIGQGIDPLYGDYLLFLQRVRPVVLCKVKEKAQKRAILEKLASETFFNIFKISDSLKLNLLVERIIEEEVNKDAK